jgi:hypothetical protein
MSRPSAIRFSRACITESRGGQTNFIQKSTNTIKAIDWPIRVAFIFTPTPLAFVVELYGVGINQ